MCYYWGLEDTGVSVLTVGLSAHQGQCLSIHGNEKQHAFSSVTGGADATVVM